jgi:hypothetical protein
MTTAEAGKPTLHVDETLQRSNGPRDFAGIARGAAPAEHKMSPCSDTAREARRMHEYCGMDNIVTIVEAALLECVTGGTHARDRGTWRTKALVRFLNDPQEQQRAMRLQNEYDNPQLRPFDWR